MVQAFNWMLHPWMSALALILWLGVVGPSPSWADKAPQPLSFDAATYPTAVLSLYETTPAAQPDAVKALLKTSKSFYKKVPGFASFSLFSSTDGTRLLQLTQWESEASYEAFQASLTTEDAEDYTKYYEKYTKAKDGKGGSMAAPTPLLTAAFIIEQSVAPPGMLPVIAGENSLVQISGLAADTSEHQDPLLQSATAALENLSSFYPAPRSATLLRGIDQPYVALLTNWGSMGEFSDPDQVPRLVVPLVQVEVEPRVEPSLAESPTPSVTGSADEPDWVTRDENLYQLVKVIAPKVGKYDKE